MDVFPSETGYYMLGVTEVQVKISVGDNKEDLRSQAEGPHCLERSHGFM